MSFAKVGEEGSMFRLRRSNPVKEIVTGVNELLRRLRASEIEPRVFWRLHGREKLRSFLEAVPQLAIPSTLDAEAARWLEREISSVLASLERRPPGSEQPEDPDCLRSLVFSNVLTHAAGRGVDHLSDWRSNYVGALSALGLLPRLDDASAEPVGEPVSIRRGEVRLDPHLEALSILIKMRATYDSDVAGPDERLAKQLDALQQLASQPATWSTLPAEQLRLLAYTRILHYAYSGDWTEVMALGPLYRLVTSRLPSDDRQRLVVDVAQVLDSQERHRNALMPFLFHDPDPAVVSTASLSFATLCPLEGDDPMTGPRRALEQLRHAAGNPVMAAGIVAGVLFLGDRRTLPLLADALTLLDRPAQVVLRDIRSPWLCASMVEFYLDWLWQSSEDQMGIPAGAIARFPIEFDGQPVRDIVRKFPSPYNVTPSSAPDDQPIRIVNEWSIPEYGRLIESRLRVVAMRETYDPIMPEVLAAWGLDPGPQLGSITSSDLDSHAEMQDPAEADRTATSLVTRYLEARFGEGVLSSHESTARALEIVFRELDQREEAQQEADDSNETDDPGDLDGSQGRQEGESHPRTFVVSASGDGDFTRLDEAVAAVAPSSQIIVRPGVYGIGFAMQEPLEVIGDGPVDRIVVTSTNHSVIALLASRGLVRGLTIVGRGGPGSYGIWAVSTETVVEDCVITSDGAAGVFLLASDARPTIRRCKIHDCTGNGVLVQEKAGGTIEECEIVGNGLAGVAITHEAAPVVRRNRIVRGRHVGIGVAERAGGLVEDNDILENALQGVVIDTGADPRLRLNRIRDNGGSGVVVSDDGTGLIERCEIMKNRGAGIEIRNGGAPRLKNNRIISNRYRSVRRGAELNG